jgi:hypothetical protein
LHAIKWLPSCEMNCVSASCDDDGDDRYGDRCLGDCHRGDPVMCHLKEVVEEDQRILLCHEM